MQRVIFCRRVWADSNYSLHIFYYAITSYASLGAHGLGCLGLLKIVTLRPTVMVHAPGPARHPEEVLVALCTWAGRHPHYTTLLLLVKAIPLLNNRH